MRSTNKSLSSNKPMFVKKLTLRDFRNHHSKSFNFEPGINIVTGPNASGKTNIVESIYYLSLARSFRGVEDNELVRKGFEYGVIEATIMEGKIKRDIQILITKKGRSVVVNGKKVSKISELSKVVNVLLFEPKDVMLFKGSPKDRRNFLDINLSKKYPVYLEYISNYNKALANRNDILKSEKVDEKLLESTTELLVKYSAPIVEYRTRYVKDITDILIKITRALTGEESKIRIDYKPFVTPSTNFESEALEAFKRSLDSDLKHKATSIGVHREDFSVSLNDKEIDIYGSQGENRMIALALKISPYFLIEDKDKRPIIVLDDVMSELDKKHRKRLVELLRKLGQVFITATELEIDGAAHIKL